MAKSENADQAEAKVVQAQRALRRKNKKIRRLTIGLVLLLIIIIGAGIFGALQYKDLKQTNDKLSNPQEAAKFDNDRVKSQVSSLITVPSDEEPVIATVSDAEKLKKESPTFFANAQNGDRLLLYQKAKKGILYRPSEKKIVEVSTLTVGQGGQAQTSAPQGTTQTPATPAQ